MSPEFTKSSEKEKILESLHIVAVGVTQILHPEEKTTLLKDQNMLSIKVGGEGGAFNLLNAGKFLEWPDSH